MSRRRRTSESDLSAATDRGEVTSLPKLGALEGNVMAVLWDDGGWVSSRQTLERLPSPPVRAYTTAMTVLVRLWRKGLVERRKDGRAFVYRALFTREQWTARRMSHLLSVAENHAAALASFVDSVSQEDRDELRRVLRLEP